MLTSLTAAESTLGLTDPPLTTQQKRRSAKLRKGGEPIVTQIGSLAAQYQLTTSAMDVATMLALVSQSSVLQPLADALTMFLKHVTDSMFAAQSQAWDTALQYYALLKRRAKTTGDLATSLQPIAAFLAFRSAPTKPPKGSPTKAQVKAAKKAQKALATVANGELAGTNLLNPRKKTVEPAAPASSPAPAPAGTSPNGSPATNGSAAPAARS